MPSMKTLKRDLSRYLASVSDTYTGQTFLYNIDNNRKDQAQVARELMAMASTGADDIVVIEAIGNDMPFIPGYKRLQDKSTRSRANIVVYVRNDHDLHGPWWDDHTMGWPETQGSGIHVPRSTMYYNLGYVQKVAGHQAPDNAKNSGAIQMEGIHRTARRMSPWGKKSWGKKSKKQRLVQLFRPRMLQWDANARIGESGPGPDLMAQMIRGKAYGRWIDNVVVRNMKILKIVALTSVKRVKLRSDHKHAVLVTWRVPALWMRKKGS